MELESESIVRNAINIFDRDGEERGVNPDLSSMSSLTECTFDNPIIVRQEEYHSDLNISRLGNPHELQYEKECSLRASSEDSNLSFHPSMVASSISIETISSVTPTDSMRNDNTISSATVGEMEDDTSMRSSSTTDNTAIVPSASQINPSSYFNVGSSLLDKSDNGDNEEGDELPPSLLKNLCHKNYSLPPPTPATPNGIDSFSSRTDTKLCPICNQIIVGAVMRNCSHGHVFCTSCVEETDPEEAECHLTPDGDQNYLLLERVNSKQNNSKLKSLCPACEEPYTLSLTCAALDGIILQYVMDSSIISPREKQSYYTRVEEWRDIILKRRKSDVKRIIDEQMRIEDCVVRECRSDERWQIIWNRAVGGASVFMAVVLAIGLGRKN